MNEFKGVITYVQQGEGSKSEGFIAYISLEDEVHMKQYQLYRKDVFSLNDTYFEKYNNLIVIVRGEIKMESWIEVESIEVIEVDNI